MNHEIPFEELVANEQKRQKSLGFNSEFDKTHTPFEWAGFINRVATRNLIKLPEKSTNIDEFKKDLVKIAALAATAYKSIEE